MFVRGPGTLPIAPVQATVGLGVSLEDFPYLKKGTSHIVTGSATLSAVFLSLFTRVVLIRVACLLLGRGCTIIAPWPRSGWHLKIRVRPAAE